MRENNNKPLLRGLKKWADLKIGTKIGIGFGMLIFLAALIGIISNAFNYINEACFIVR